MFHVHASPHCGQAGRQPRIGSPPNVSRLNRPDSSASFQRMHRSRSPRFETFVSDARRRPHLWRLLAGVCVSALVYAVWAWAVLTIYGRAAGQEGSAAIRSGRTPGDAYILLSTIIGMALGVALAARSLHRRRPASLFGPSATVLRDFVITAALVGAVQGVALALWSIGHDAKPGMDASVWLPLLPFSLLAVLLQTGAEELAFRGYLQQQLAARFRSPVVWMLVPSIGFGMAHYNPDVTGGNLWLFVFGTICFGLAAADLTARTGSIGAAWGFHFANNTLALLILGMDGMVSGLSLFVTPFDASDPEAGPMILAASLTLGVAWLLARPVLGR